MGNNDLHSRFRSLLGLGAAVLLVGGTASRCLAEDAPAQLAALEQSSAPEHSAKNTQATRNAEKIKHHVPDFSAKKRMGKASFYANEFSGRKMADGAVMDPHGDNAASKTLPLGTTAKVTNLETGKSAVVTIQDRGPYVPGRIVDLSPATARQIGISHRKGVALVVVAPIAVPQPDGGIKLGAAAHESLAGTTVTKAIKDASIRDAAVDTRTVQR
jgi:rare lipoprotein A